VIVGHSDNQGSLEANIALSKRRAEAVRTALITRGVAAERLEAHGVGYLAPVSTNLTEAGRTLNRRVELVLR
jgi:OOP family OmpA-OmpF porin